MLESKFKLFLVMFVIVVMVVSTLGIAYSNGFSTGSSPAATTTGTTASQSNIVGEKYQRGNHGTYFYEGTPFNNYKSSNDFINVTDPYNGIVNDSSVQASPPPAVPDTKPINITLFSNFTVTHWCPTISGTFKAPTGKFASVVVTYNGQATGEVYDSAFWLKLDNATVYTGSTPEYGNWSVQVNVTQFSALLSGNVNYFFYPPMSIVNGSFINSMTISFYPVASGSHAPSEPSMVLSTPLNYANDISTANITVPNNTIAAKLLIYAYGYGADEFWYANEPSYSPFENIQVSSGTTPIANILPFPYINTGGINAFQWRPVTGVHTLNDMPYELNVTSALGILEGSHNLTIKMNKIDPGSFWQVSADLLIYTSASAGPASLLYYNFTEPQSSTHVSSSNLNYTTEASSKYSYYSYIPTTTGYILAGTQNYETFFNTQDFNSSNVWQNITQLSATNTVDRTTYFSNGQYANQIRSTSTLFPLVMDLGFPSIVVSTTNGGYPMIEDMLTEIPVLEQGWLQKAITETRYSSGISGLTEHVTDDSVVVTNAFNVENVTLTSPYAGLINSVNNVSSLTTKYYYSATIVNSTLVSSYAHIIKALAFNASPPNYAASIIYDEIGELSNLPLTHSGIHLYNLFY